MLLCFPGVVSLQLARLLLVLLLLLYSDLRPKEELTVPYNDGILTELTEDAPTEMCCF